MRSPCADVMNFAFEMTGKNVEAVRQLRQDAVADFNKINVNRRGVKFSMLAGNPLPTMCKTVVWNDGVVPVPSAKWKIPDNAESKSIDTDLTGTSDFSSFVKPHLAIEPKARGILQTAIEKKAVSLLNSPPFQCAETILLIPFRTPITP